MPDRLIVFGSGGHAKVVVEAVLARTPNREIVILDDAEEARSRTVLGLGVFGGRDQLGDLQGAPVALGIGNNRARFDLMRWLRERSHTLETVIHPAATVATSVRLGEGAFVSAGAIVIAETLLGAGAIINTSASVDHDCEIGEATHIGPGVHLCGNVRIGNRSLIGVGAAIRPGVSVCEDVVVGAGAVVVRDITSPGTFAGNPARPLRSD